MIEISSNGRLVAVPPPEIDALVETLGGFLGIGRQMRCKSVRPHQKTEKNCVGPRLRTLCARSAQPETCGSGGTKLRRARAGAVGRGRVAGPDLTPVQRRS